MYCICVRQLQYTHYTQAVKQDWILRTDTFTGHMMQTQCLQSLFGSKIWFLRHEYTNIYGDMCLMFIHEVPLHAVRVVWCATGSTKMSGRFSPFVPFFFLFLVPETINSTPDPNAFRHHLLNTCSITRACTPFFSKTEASVHTGNSSEHF